jgi:GxxExxY protein
MVKHELFEEDLTRSVIGAFFTVYSAMGFGFLEHLYVQALERELRARGHGVAREVGITVRYEGDILGQQRLDMVVDGKLVVEVKATELLHASARRQVINYLRCTNLELGLLLHFGPAPKFYRLIFTNDRKGGPATA